MNRTLLSVALGVAVVALAPGAAWAQKKGGGAARGGGASKPNVVGAPKPNIAGAHAGAPTRPVGPSAAKATARGGGRPHARGGGGRGRGRGGMSGGRGGMSGGRGGGAAGLAAGRRNGAAAARPMGGGMGGVPHLPLQGGSSAGYDPLIFPLVQPDQAAPGANGAPADAAQVAPGMDPTQGGVPLPVPSADPATPTGSNLPGSVRRQ